MLPIFGLLKPFFANFDPEKQRTLMIIMKWGLFKQLIK
jgi:hypothetical protein